MGRFDSSATRSIGGGLTVGGASHNLDSQYFRRLFFHSTHTHIQSVNKHIPSAAKSDSGTGTGRSPRTAPGQCSATRPLSL